MRKDRYNHFVKKLLSLGLPLLPVAAVLFLASCAKDIQNSEAVRQGVVDYLKQRSGEIGINMDNIDVTVTNLSFEKDVARASVSFSAKGGPPNGGMSMSYVLDRKGDKWAVRGRQTSSGNPHGGGQALPGTQPLPGGVGAPGDQPVGQPLPPGHPSVGSKQ
jgi:hypothetical protein